MPSILLSTLHKLSHLTLIKPYDINVVLLTLQMVTLKLRTKVKYHIANQFWASQVAQWLKKKKSTCQCRRCKLDPCTRKIPWRRKWQPTPVFLPGKSRGQRSLVGPQSMGLQRVRHYLANDHAHMQPINSRIRMKTWI